MKAKLFVQAWFTIHNPRLHALQDLFNTIDIYKNQYTPIL